MPTFITSNYITLKKQTIDREVTTETILMACHFNLYNTY